MVVKGNQEYMDTTGFHMEALVRLEAGIGQLYILSTLEVEYPSGIGTLCCSVLFLQQTVSLICCLRCGALRQLANDLCNCSSICSIPYQALLPYAGAIWWKVNVLQANSNWDIDGSCTEHSWHSRHRHTSHRMFVVYDPTTIQNQHQSQYSSLAIPLLHTLVGQGSSVFVFLNQEWCCLAAMMQSIIELAWDPPAASFLAYWDTASLGNIIDHRPDNSNRLSILLHTWNLSTALLDPRLVEHCCQ